MTHKSLNLTRDQFATFLKNHEQIKKFEKLFQIVEQVSSSSDTQGNQIVAEDALSLVNEALSQIDKLIQDSSIIDSLVDQKINTILSELIRITNALELSLINCFPQDGNRLIVDHIGLFELEQKINYVLSELTRISNTLEVTVISSIPQDNNLVDVDSIRVLEWMSI